MKQSCAYRDGLVWVLTHWCLQAALVEALFVGNRVVDLDEHNVDSAEAPYVVCALHGLPCWCRRVVVANLLWW